MDHRLRLFLNAEKAFGLESIRLPRGSVRSEGKPAARPEPQIPARQPERTIAPPPNRTPVPTGPKPQQPAPPPAAKRPLFVLDEPFTADVLNTKQKALNLKTLDETQVSGCTKCRLCETRTQTVFGEGDVDAKLMFIGEGPGENEDLSGRPFVGRAGQLLDKMIAAMGLSREQVYIANVVKCRPPNNRAPMPDETAACTPYLLEQIETIRPEVIVTLGLPATRFILQQELSMGRMRGQFHDWRGLKVMPTYHPSYVLRSYTPETRAAVWSDLQQVMKLLKLKGPSKKSDGI
jgi:DNA polymerase